MKYDKAKCLKFYLDLNRMCLYNFSQKTGISMEDLEGIFLHTTPINQSMSKALAEHTDMKDPKFWTDSKENY